MPKYFFHIEGSRPYRDKFGEELPNDRMAWREAMRLARDIEDTLEPGQNWRLIVVDGQAVIYVIAITTENRSSDKLASDRTT
jgi:hypothetical protein